MQIVFRPSIAYIYPPKPHYETQVPECFTDNLSFLCLLFLFLFQVLARETRTLFPYNCCQSLRTKSRRPLIFLVLLGIMKLILKRKSPMNAKEGRECEEWSCASTRLTFSWEFQSKRKFPRTTEFPNTPPSTNVGVSSLRDKIISTNLTLFDESWCWTTKNGNCLQESGNIFSTSRRLVKKKELSRNLVLFSVNEKKTSTELQLFDECCTNKNGKARPDFAHRLSTSAPENKETTSGYNSLAAKISGMKHYSPEKKEEEKRTSVSTTLSIYEHPWKMKKRLTDSDLGGSSRLLMKAELIRNYVLPLLTADHIGEVYSKDGAKVAVWDKDTESNHELVFKHWATCYVLIGKWNREFVKRRNLKNGDEIGLYWNPYQSRFNFSVLRRNWGNQVNH